MVLEPKKTKRVALIQPPRKSGVLNSYLPIGLLSLASSIKKHGYQPIFIDLYLFSVIQRNFFNSFRQMAIKILNYNPDILGFSVMCNTLPASLLIAKECKKLVPELPIIFGGPEVCFEEIELLEAFKQVDIIVRGEGEIILVEVLKALENKRPLSDILGITYRENGEIIRNPDCPLIENLDQLPFLDFSLVPRLEMYDVRIEAGRGCPFSCTFCSTCQMWKRNFRMKSPQRVVQDLKQAFCFFKNSSIGITHDNFLTSRKFAEEFFSLMANEGITWGCSSRLDALDVELVKKLKQAGCRQIFFGIESGSPEMQKKIRKNLSLIKLPRILGLLCQNGIEIFLSFIIGFPNETESQIDQTLLMALNSKVFIPSIEINIDLFTFLKGTELYARTKEKFAKYEYRESIVSPLTTSLSAELSLIKSYPHLFPSFYYIGSEELQSKTLHKMAFLFLFLIKSYARPVLLLLEHLSVTPYQLGQKLISFFDAEGVDWKPTQGYHFPQYVSPLRKFVQEYASPLYKEFFWWDEVFKRWEKR